MSGALRQRLLQILSQVEQGKAGIPVVTRGQIIAQIVTAPDGEKLNEDLCVSPRFFCVSAIKDVALGELFNPNAYGWIPGRPLDCGIVVADLNERNVLGTPNIKFTPKRVIITGKIHNKAGYPVWMGEHLLLDWVNA